MKKLIKTEFISKYITKNTFETERRIEETYHVEYDKFNIPYDTNDYDYAKEFLTDLINVYIRIVLLTEIPYEESCIYTIKEKHTEKCLPAVIVPTKKGLGINFEIIYLFDNEDLFFEKHWSLEEAKFRIEEHREAKIILEKVERTDDITKNCRIILDWLTQK